MWPETYGILNQEAVSVSKALIQSEYRVSTLFVSN